MCKCSPLPEHAQGAGKFRLLAVMTTHCSLHIHLYMKIVHFKTIVNRLPNVLMRRMDACKPMCCYMQGDEAKRNAMLFFIEGAVQWLNLVFWVVPNVYLLVNPCYFYGGAIFWCGWARWTCWNTVSFAASLLYTCFMVRLLLLAFCCIRC